MHTAVCNSHLFPDHTHMRFVCPHNIQAHVLPRHRHTNTHTCVLIHAYTKVHTCSQCSAHMTVVFPQYTAIKHMHMYSCVHIAMHTCAAHISNTQYMCSHNTRHIKHIHVCSHLYIHAVHMFPAHRTHDLPKCKSTHMLTAVHACMHAYVQCTQVLS